MEGGTPLSCESQPAIVPKPYCFHFQNFHIFERKVQNKNLVTNGHEWSPSADPAIDYIVVRLSFSNFRKNAFIQNLLQTGAKIY